MNRTDRLYLLSERDAVRKMLDATPEDNVIDRYSLEGRLEMIDEQLHQATGDEHEPVRARLTFNGRPVVGSHGILADFGMRAVNSFTEAVSWMAASLVAPLASSGPLPNREQYQLLITNTALGSFGFELEEYRSSQLQLEATSPVAQALESTGNLLRSTLGNDEELLEAASETDPRALEKVRAFLQVLADGEAVCNLQLRDRSIRFTDVDQIHTSLRRLSQDNLREEQIELDGEFLGVLPRSRAFEFRQQPDGDIIRGKVAPAVTEIEQINHHTEQRVRIQVMQTRIGNGRPRHLLLALPVWPQDATA